MAEDYSTSNQQCHSPALVGSGGSWQGEVMLVSSRKDQHLVPSVFADGLGCAGTANVSQKMALPHPESTTGEKLLLAASLYTTC